MLNTSAATAIGATVLFFTAGTLASVLVGMYAVDLTDHRLSANTTIGACRQHDRA